jgi:hypothetical protein
MATSFTLPDHPTLPKGKPVAVIVLDGWGEASADQYNCIHRAETPVMDSLKNVCSFATHLCTPFMLDYGGLHSWLVQRPGVKLLLS